MLPIAHAGHYIAGLLYLAPLLLVVGALGFSSLRDKRRGESAPRIEPPSDDSADLD